MPIPSRTLADHIPEVEKIVRFIGRAVQLRREELDTKIVKAIRECPDLTTLQLEIYSVALELAKALGKALETQSSLKKVVCRHMFTYTSILEIPPALASMIKGITTANAQLVVLDLSENCLDVAGLVSLKYFFESPCSYSLEEFYISNNRFGTDGAKLLSDFMTTYIENCTKDGKEMKLKCFECSYNDLKNDGVAFLAKCLEGIHSLVSIDLAYNDIGPSGITALSNVFESNPLLEKIKLTGNNLYESGTNRLASCLTYLEKLEILELRKCHVGSNGVLHLAAAFKYSCPEVVRIDLSCNEIHSNVDELLDAMEGKKFFEDVDISENDFSQNAEEALRMRIFNIKKELEMMSSDDEDLYMVDSD